MNVIKTVIDYQLYSFDQNYEALCHFREHKVNCNHLFGVYLRRSCAT